MNFRHKYNIELQISVEEDINRIKVPRFFMQPIIENSIIHGESQNEGAIIITAFEKNHQLIIKISDNGVGMSDEVLKKLVDKLDSKEYRNINKKNGSFTGIGVQNVYQRLKLIYGDDFYLEVISRENEGTTFIFNIPIVEGEEGNV